MFGAFESKCFFFTFSFLLQSPCQGRTGIFFVPLIRIKEKQVRKKVGTLFTYCGCYNVIDNVNNAIDNVITPTYVFKMK